MKMWLYDSWEGMPETRPEDGAEAKKYVKWGKDATMEGVKAWLIEVGMNVDQGGWGRPLARHAYLAASMHWVDGCWLAQCCRRAWQPSDAAGAWGGGAAVAVKHVKQASHCVLGALCSGSI